MSRSYTASPPSASMACSGTAAFANIAYIFVKFNKPHISTKQNATNIYYVAPIFHSK
jgi:hypothetical protein